MLKKPYGIKNIHFQAVLVLIVYLFFSKSVTVASFTSSHLSVSFFGPFVFGSLAGLVFLYLFSHEDFFPVAREIEKEEKIVERKWLDRFSRHGKISICLAVGVLAGPLLGALTVRLLIHNRGFWYKAVIILAGEALSAAASMGLIKGLINIF